MKIERILGEWINPKEETEGIERFYFTKHQDSLQIEIHGSESSIHPGTWGNYKVNCHANSRDSDQFSAFYTTVNIAHSDILIAGNINKGLVIIAMYINIDPGTHDSNFFIREFFYHSK